MINDVKVKIVKHRKDRKCVKMKKSVFLMKNVLINDSDMKHNVYFRWWNSCVKEDRHVLLMVKVVE